MKKLLLLSLTVMAFGSCSHDFGDYGTVIDVNKLQDKNPNEVTQEDIQANAASYFGAIDPEQDWNMITTGSVTVTADANLANITKVQILTESPYFNPDASILCEANVSNGETVTLQFDAPSANKRLIALCLNSEGRYFTKGFNVGDANVSFSSPSAARSMTRDANSYPSASAIKLEVKNSVKSFNAARTQYANLAAESGNATLKQWVNDNKLNFWQDKGWENERLWKATKNNNAGSNWVVDDNGIISRSVADLDASEVTELEDIFNTFLKRDNKRDNLALIRNSTNVGLYTNHLISDGTPVIVSPVQLASTEIRYCTIYYYYYDPEAIPATMSEEEYVKKLPKFALINCSDAKKAAQAIGKSIEKDSKDFFKAREYILPYYGDNIQLKTLEGYETDGKIYRIRNGQKYKDEDYYLSYTGNKDRCGVSTFMDETNIDYANQLWQIFTNPETGFSFLYNIGFERFLMHDEANEKSYLTPFSTSDLLEGNEIPVVIDKENHKILRSNSTTMGLGTDLDNAKKAEKKAVSSDKDVSKPIGQWYFEEYEDVCGLMLKNRIETASNLQAKDMVIPVGHKVGFMIRKAMNGSDATDRKVITAKNNGCSYGFGSMNREINQYPDFSSAITRYSMKLDDPRILMFSANDNKTYLAFEEGVDCQYSDAILEITQGVNIITEPLELEAATYTVCIEDRPIADYDLNDVVMKATRKDATHVILSLVACGAYDELYIHGLNGNIFNENREVHDLLGAERGTYANTQGSIDYPPVSEEFEIGNTTSLMDFLRGISIYDATIDHTITFSGRSDDPHAIVVPDDFKYPSEHNSIKNAYPTFTNWARNRNVDNNWYKSPDTKLINK